MKYSAIQRFLGVVLVWSALTNMLVEGQYGNCRNVVAKAADLATDRCNCPRQPQCSTCFDVGGTRDSACSNSCIFYTGTLQKISSMGFFEAGFAEADIGFGWVYYFEFTTGFAKSNVRFEYNTYDGCTATLRGITCQYCNVGTCDPDGRLQFDFDCGNVRTGAVAAPCAFRDHGTGISLARSARKTALIGLIYPFLECSMKRVKAVAKPFAKTLDMEGSSTALLSGTSSSPKTMSAMTEEEEENLWWNSTMMTEYELLYGSFSEDDEEYEDTVFRPFTKEELANLTELPFFGNLGFVSPDTFPNSASSDSSSGDGGGGTHEDAVEIESEAEQEQDVAPDKASKKLQFSAAGNGIIRSVGGHFGMMILVWSALAF